jgi:hypothetical protein
MRDPTYRKLVNQRKSNTPEAIRERSSLKGNKKIVDLLDSSVIGNAPNDLVSYE